jgi:hypothetical protein
VQRLLVLACTSLPASPVFAQPATAPLLAFGLSHLALEALTRRVGGCHRAAQRPAWCRGLLPRGLALR